MLGSLHGHMSTVVPSASGCGYGYGYGSGSGSGSAYLSCASPPAMSQQQQVCHRETMEVSLHSYAKGAFGLVLQRQQPTATAAAAAANPGGVGIGGSACCSTPMPLFISYIEKGSSAERCGVLQVGDRVLTINEWYTANGTVEEANHIMRHSSSPLTLTVEFDVIESLLPPNGILNVKLAKRGNNLGIVTKSETDGRKGEPVIISDIRTGSVAQRCGSISVGDRILAIDNIPLESCTVEEAMRLLQRCGDVVKLRIRKAILQDENESSHTVVYSIELNRKGRPMGITIASRGERGDPVIISQLAPRGLAERTGALRVGDRILAVNGESIEGKKVSDAMHLLQQSGDIVTIKISRYIDQNFNHPYSNSYYPLNSSSCGRYRMMGAAAIPQTIHSSTGQVTDSYNEPPDKLGYGTPIQSIDSAVESLEDSPVQLQQHTSKSSSAQHRFSADDRISNVQLQYLCEDERNNDWSNIRDTAANDHHHNTTADDNRNEISNHKNGWDSGMSSTTDNNYCMMMECCSCQNATTSSSAAAATDDWVKILEALETVGEAEMLKKLEDSIMSGAVPPPQLNMRPHALGHAATSSGVTAATTQAAGLISSSGGGLLSPCASILGRQQPPFTPSNTNTILKHPPLTGCATSSTTAQLSSRPLMSGSVGSDRGDSLSVHSGDSLTGCSLSYEIPPSMPPPKPPRYEQQQQQQQPLAQAASSSAATAVVGTGAVVSTLLQQPCILNPLSVPPVGVATASETPLFTQSASYAINSPMTSSSRNLLSNRSIKPSTSGLMLHELNAKTDYFKEAATSSVIAAAPSTAAVTCTEKQPKGTTHRVVLHRDPAMGGFGFSVSDGAGDNPGVFINAILPGGPADRSGQIQPLDRILQVNDTSLQFLDCDLAVPLLSVDRIELLLYRDGTLNCIDEVDEAINNTAALNRFNLKDSAV
ncbi:unnamed protein product [Anisakis simplex]|uniref:Glutamate receptor-interacting protein 1 (inferred by orthology to a human protein) n=1 Tax=Anisakis simplex TaxID=6269 RepID=A0A0M3K1T0_ANISI|nr:unnamed protein product [Anisakis simplex]